MRQVLSLAPFVVSLVVFSCGDGGEETSGSPEGMGGESSDPSSPDDDDMEQTGDGGMSSSCPDADGDGFNSVECGGDDCDDSDPNRFPGNEEVCDGENRDEDCDPNTFGDLDSDDDGFVSAACCNERPNGDLTCGDDCDDDEETVHPTQGELCDNLDNDCDGEIDENPNREWYADVDGDGRGDPDNFMTECVTGTGFVANANDCDDSDDQKWSGADEDDCDGIDNDCDGDVDEDSAFFDYVSDSDGDLHGTGTPVSLCEAEPEGLIRVADSLGDDCDDALMSVNPSATDICNGVDDDCQGGVDPTCPTSLDQVSAGGTALLNGGTPNGNFDSRTCLAGELLVGLEVYDDFTEERHFGYRLICAGTEIENGQVVWQGSTTSFRGTLGQTEEPNALLCPDDSFVSSVSAAFDAEGYATGLAVDCVEASLQPSATALQLTEVASLSHGSAVEDEVECETTGALMFGMRGYVDQSGTSQGMSRLSFACRTVEGVLP